MHITRVTIRRATIATIHRRLQAVLRSIEDMGSASAKAIAASEAEIDEAAQGHYTATARMLEQSQQLMEEASRHHGAALEAVNDARNELLRAVTRGVGSEAVVKELMQTVDNGIRSLRHKYKLAAV